MQRVLFAEDKHPEDFKPLVETVELAHSVRHRIDEFDIGEVLRFGKFWELNRAKASSLCIIQKYIVDYSPTIVVII